MYIDRLPSEIIQKLKDTDQPLKYHPERTVYNHIFLVEKEAQKFQDLNLSIAAVFHDIGKPDALQMRGDRPVFYGHEFRAEKYINALKHLFDDLELNWDMIKWICVNHMRSHIIDKMRPHKRRAIMDHEWFPQLMKFSTCDNNGRLPVEEINDTDGR